MKRREVVALVSGAVLSGLWETSAVAAERTHRVGWLGTNASSFTEPYGLAFVQRLGELGFIEGPSLTIEKRHADNNLERQLALATELAKLNCDVLFGGGPEANLAALTQSSRETPIVFVALD